MHSSDWLMHGSGCVVNSRYYTNTSFARSKWTLRVKHLFALHFYIFNAMFQGRLYKVDNIVSLGHLYFTHITKTLHQRCNDICIVTWVSVPSHVTRILKYFKRSKAEPAPLNHLYFSHVTMTLSDALQLEESNSFQFQTPSHVTT